MKWTFETDDVARPLAPGEFGVSKSGRVMHWNSAHNQNTVSEYFPFPESVQCTPFEDSLIMALMIQGVK